MDPKQITNPRGRWPIRLPTYPDTRQTALVTLERVTSGKIDATTGSNVLYALIPSPVYPVWSTQPQAARRAALKYSLFNTVGTASSTVTVGTERVPSIVGASSDSTTEFMPIIGWRPGNFFMYSPNMKFKLKFIVPLTTFTNTDPITVVLEYLVYEATGGVLSRSQTVSCPGVAASTESGETAFTAQGKWISPQRVTFQAIGTTAATYASPFMELVVDLLGTTADGWLPDSHSYPIEWESSTEPYTACRINASQLTIYNTTANLNREGSVQVTRMQSEKVQPWLADSTQLNDAPPSLRYVAPLERGVETFTLPPFSSGSFIDCTRLAGVSGVNLPTFDLTLNYQYSLISLTDPATATATVLTLTYHEHREFCVSSQLFAVGVSKMSLDAVLKTLQRVALVPPARMANAPTALTYSGMPGGPQKEQKDRPAGRPRRRPRRQRGGPSQPSRAPRPQREAAPRASDKAPRRQGGLAMYMAMRPAPKPPAPRGRGKGAPRWVSRAK